jgi:hypothetical protein
VTKSSSNDKQVVQVKLETPMQKNTSQGTKASTSRVKEHHTIATDRPRCTIKPRAKHGSVWESFGLFSHPTCAHQVWNFPTRSSKGNVKNQRVFGWFGVGFFSWVGRADWVFLGDFHLNDQEQNLKK